MRPDYCAQVSEALDWRAGKRHVPNFSNNHEGHAKPPPGVLKVAVTLACFFIVLFVGLQQAMFLDDERGADEDSGRDGQDKTDDFIRAGAGCCVAAHAAGAGVELVGGMEEVCGRVHGF
jgi:hypothetical protein